MNTGWRAHPAHYVVVLVAAGLSFFVGLGAVPLFDKDEGAFTEATRYMLASGNYVMTYLNGEPRYDKPILIYWLQALSAKAFGLNEFALRLPSAIAASAWAGVLLVFARRYLGSGRAVLATLFLVTAVQVTIIGKAAIADALLNLCITACLLSIWRYLDSGAVGWRHLAFAAAGVGMLTKGPVALLVPGLATLAYYLSRAGWRSWRSGLRAWAGDAFAPAGIAIFAAINLPWYAWASADQGWPILREWVGVQLLARMGGEMDGHGGSVVYYVPVVLLGLLPWTALFVIAARHIRSDWREPLPRFCWLWFLTTFVFFSLIGTKLPHYVIYGYPPLFLLMARHAHRLQRPAWVLGPAAALLALFFMLPWLLPAVRARVDDAYAAAVLAEAEGLFGAAWYLTLGLGIAVLVALCFAPARWRFAQFAAAGLILMSAVNFLLMPRVAAVMQEPIRDAALYAREQGYDVVKWKFNMPSFIFYRAAEVPERIPQTGDIVVTEVQQLDAFEGFRDYERLWERGGVVLVRVGETPAG